MSEPAVTVRAVGELQPHPEHRVVPSLSIGELQALRADIAARGVRVPLEVTAAGVVLDGHARLAVARQLGLAEVPTLVVTAEEPVAHMLRAALNRRQLDASQKAALALKLLPFEQLRDRARQRQEAGLRSEGVRATLPAPTDDGAVVATLPAPAEGRTRDLVAELAGASPRTVQDVITVHDHDPELFEQIAAGEIAAHTAARRTRRQLRDATLPPEPPLPDGCFELIYADPPWRFPGSPDSSRAVENHYPTMPLDQILALNPPAAEDGLLFLWAVNSLLPQALHVIEAWGFTYITQFAWVKDKWGLGQYNRCQHELLLVGRRGSYPPPVEDRRQSSVIDARRRRHSQKPDQAYQLLEAMYPAASKLELFARGPARPGWTVWGNQAEPETEQT